MGVLSEHHEHITKAAGDRYLNFVIPELANLRDDLQALTDAVLSIKNQQAYLLAQHGLTLDDDEEL